MQIIPQKDRKTPFSVVFYRAMFALFFVVAGWAVYAFGGLDAKLTAIWLAYLGLVYAASETIYAMFLKRGIDLAFAFPLLLAAYIIKFTALMLGGQTTFPLINRVEHFLIFILLSYIVWIFFTQYLTLEIWKKRPFYTSIIVFSVVSAIGVINEVAELAIDGIFGINTVAPGYDTSYDLALNTVGILFFLGIRLLYGTGGDDHK